MRLLLKRDCFFTMRIRCILYVCILAISICKCDVLQVENSVKEEQAGKKAQVQVEENVKGHVARKAQWQVTPAIASHRTNTYSLMSDAVSHAASHDSSSSSCGEDWACIEEGLSEFDKQGLEAIQWLHRQLDDDANGNVDLSESDDFLREELQYDSGYERRQQAFHHNDDMHISARELWEAWLRSEVHNWTVEQTTEWLEKSVELPQYVKTFIDHKITGAILPRMAMQNIHFLSTVLGIKDPIHKQKIALKAMDVVLFGPPKDGGHRWKDVVLVTLILGVVVGCWYAYKQNRSSRSQMYRMLKDMESLRQAELALDTLQKELQRARMEQENVATEKQNLEKRLMEVGTSGESLSTSYSNLEVSQLKAEIELLRNELQRAEGELEDRCWAPPAGLQLWLQLTYELENKTHLRKKNNADLQLQQARDACEKLRKKRSSLVGAFVSTHGKSIDDVDRSIVEARTALNEVTQDLQERVYRWKQMELLCGFNIINNSGLQYLESTLYRNINGRPNRLKMSSSQDDLDMDECSSVYGMSQGQGQGPTSSGWKEDSSGSDDFEPPESKHYPMDFRLGEARAHFEEKRLAEDHKAQELRSQYFDRISQYRNHLREARSQTSMLDPNNIESEMLPRNLSNGRSKEPIVFTLGADNVNWTGEDLPASSLRSNSQSRSQPQLNRNHASMRVAANLSRMPLPPPRRNTPLPGPMLRSQSTEADLDDSVDDPPPIPNTTDSHKPPIVRQGTVASEDGTGSSSSEQSLATQQADVITSTIAQTSEGDIEPRPRRRKIHFPFSKKSSKSTGLNQL